MLSEDLMTHNFYELIYLETIVFENQYYHKTTFVKELNNAEKSL